MSIVRSFEEATSLIQRSSLWFCSGYKFRRSHYRHKVSIAEPEAEIVRLISLDEEKAGLIVLIMATIQLL